MLHINEEMLERYDSLSGGEKKRIQIASVLVLENALVSLSCSLLVVSHDKAFLEKTTDRHLYAERNGTCGKIVCK